MADTLIILNPEEVDKAITLMMAGSRQYFLELCVESSASVTMDEVYQRVNAFQEALSEDIKADAKWSIKFKEEKGQ